MASTSIDIGHEISPHLTRDQFTYKHLSLFIHTYKQEQQHLAVASSGTSLGTETACTRQLWLLSVCNYVAKIKYGMVLKFKVAMLQRFSGDRMIGSVL